jgi:hypothetical protein
MANQTLTTGTPSVPINFDSATLAGLANGETITINGGHLLINGDNRWGNNAAVVDSMPISTTMGGSILIDGRDVWEVPFSASSGNVPTVAVDGSNPITGAGITGELFRVWATGSLTPAAAGGAMPATGWVKLRSKTGDFSNGLVVTLPGGATITCSGAGKRSWIHVAAEEAGTVTVPRLGSFTIRGDWYELGTTNGADGQTFQYPVADACPAIQVETGVGSGEYEWWINAGSRWGTATVYVSQDARGKFFGMVNSTGVITIALRASNACGFKPASGLRVRVPNVMLSSTNSTNYALNTINATVGTRYDFTTTAAGVVDIEHASVNWYLSLTNAFRVTIKNTAILELAYLANIADTTVWDDVAVGLNAAQNSIAAVFINCFTSVSLNKCRLVRYAAAASGNQTINVQDVANYSETDCQAEIFGNTTATTRGNASVYTRLLNRLVGVNTLTRPTGIGACIGVAGSLNVTVTDYRYADCHIGATTSTNAQSALNFGTASANIKLDGFSSFAGLANVHPYNNIALSSVGCTNADIRNIGTPDAPYDCGSALACGVGVTATVTVNLQLRRIYLQNTRTAPLSIANTVQGVVIDNVWGDAADSQALAGINLLARGCRWTNSVTGQSSVYGRHWEDAWTSTTAGRILISCNEPLADTADQCQVNAGSPKFTSGGQVAMPVVGDEVEWTMPYFALGITAMAATTPLVTGTNAGNFSIRFQFDKGEGWNGTWNVASSLTIATIVGAIDPAIGIKLKVKATTATANATNAITYIRFDTVTNATDQKIQYPLPRTQLTVTGFEPGSDVVIYDDTVAATGDGTNVLATGDAVTGSYVFDYEGTPTIRIGVFKSGYVPQVTPAISLTPSNSSYTIQQRADRNYI